MNIAVEETVSGAPVKLSESAAKRIAKLIRETDGSVALRVAVEGGGCSGFQYRFDFVGEAAPDDLVVRRGDAIVLVDPISLPYMLGAEIDLVANLMEESLQVKNPLAVASCGCGTSFSI